MADFAGETNSVEKFDELIATKSEKPHVIEMFFISRPKRRNCKKWLRRVRSSTSKRTRPPTP